jgi:hypothetical protein
MSSFIFEPVERSELETVAVSVPNIDIVPYR